MCLYPWVKWVWGCFAICSSVLRDGLSKKVTIKSRHAECEGVSHVDIGSNSNPGRGMANAEALRWDAYVQGTVRMRESGRRWGLRVQKLWSAE